MRHTKGYKRDSNKARYDLIPPGPLAELASLYTAGAIKYPGFNGRNWEEGMRWGKVYAALQRHAQKYWAGESLDPENGQHHLAAVAWCAFTLMQYEHTHPDLDDRPKFKQDEIIRWIHGLEGRKK